MNWLKAIRKEKGLSQMQIASQAKIAQPTYCNIESGKRRASYEVAKELASILEIDWRLFFEANETAS